MRTKIFFLLLLIFAVAPCFCQSATEVTSSTNKSPLGGKEFKTRNTIIEVVRQSKLTCETVTDRRGQEWEIYQTRTDREIQNT